MYVLNRAKPVLPPAPPASTGGPAAGTLGGYPAPAPSESLSSCSPVRSAGPGQAVSPSLAPKKQQQQQQQQQHPLQQQQQQEKLEHLQEPDIRTMRRMAGEGGEAEPVVTSEAEGMFLNHTQGLFMDSQIAYEIHC